MGLNKIHQLTGSGRRAILRVELKHRNNPTQLHYAQYTTFEIGNEANKYKLLIGGYSGNASDSMAYHNGMKFTTKDNDNDLNSNNWAVTYTGGWWFKDCHWANLNGLYPTSRTTDAAYMSWAGLYGTNGNVIYSELKVKYL